MSDILKRKRLEKNMTLEQVGNLVGVGKSTVRKWENGLIENMGRDKIILLSKALDVSPLEILGISEDDSYSSLKDVYSKLTKDRQSKVYDFASYQLKEQNKPKISYLYGYVSAGTGEFLEDQEKEEVEIPKDAPAHDFVLSVNGDSMLPLFQDGELIYIKATSEARDGQIIVCKLNDEAYVKKLSGNKLVSLNKKYEDIPIHDYEDFKIFGTVIL